MFFPVPWMGVSVGEPVRLVGCIPYVVGTSVYMTLCFYQLALCLERWHLRKKALC